MPSSIEIQDHITDYGKKLRAEIEKMGGNAYVKAGILQTEFQEPKKEQDDTKSKSTLGEVAVANEFGTETIPSRPAIRMAADKNREGWGEFAASLLAKVVDLKVGSRQMFELLGLRMQRDIQASYASNIQPRNADSTIRQKLRTVQGAKGKRLRALAGFDAGLDQIGASGSVKTLMDTGQLHASVNYAVVDKDGEKAGKLKKTG